MIYFSDPPEPGHPGSPADTVFPTNIRPKDGGGVLEVGTEGSNGFLWQPGSNRYRGISDVPEPSTLMSGARGLLTILWRARRLA